MEHKKVHCRWYFEVIVFRPNNTALPAPRPLQLAYSVLLTFLCVIAHAMTALQR